MSVAAIYQSLPSVISDFAGKDYSTQIDLARPFVASMAEAFSILGKELVMKSASLGKRKCDLGEQERNQIHEIVDQLLKTKDVHGHPLLSTAMWVEKDRENVLKILRFLAENGFSEEVTNILLSEKNGDAIGKALSGTIHGDELNEIRTCCPKEPRSI